jgi:GcrA cell cycle regulator
MSCEPWPFERVEELKRMVADGALGPSAIGRILGVSRGAVSMKVKRLDLVWQRAATGGAPRKKSERSEADFATAATIELEPIARGDGSPVTIASVADGECRFPCGDQHGGALQLCGRTAKSGSPYCDEHSRKAFKPQKKNSP